MAIRKPLFALCVLSSALLFSGCGGVTYRHIGSYTKVESTSACSLAIQDLDVRLRRDGQYAISGRAICSYQGTEHLVRYQKVERTHRGAYGIHVGTRVEDREVSKTLQRRYSDTFVPRSLQVGEWRTTPDPASGAFSLLIGAQHPQRQPYMAVYANQRPVTATAQPPFPPEVTSPPKPVACGEYRHYRTRIDREAIQKAINGRVHKLRLYARDNATRVTVKPKWMITCSEGPTKSVALGNLFGGSSAEIQRAAADMMPSFLEPGKPIRQQGESIVLTVHDGATIQIETVDPNYHYFKGAIVADRRRRAKDVLLVDVGVKVRVDTRKEGVGGIEDRKTPREKK